MRRLAVVLALALAACAHKKSAGEEQSYSAEHLTFVDGGAGRLRASDGGPRGEGPVAVVFVHGLGGDVSTWTEALRHERQTRRAVAYDQRGHGESAPAKDGDYSVDALAGDLDRVVSSLGVDRFYLAGHSMAGLVLTAYAARHPDKVAGLVYVDAVGDLSHAPPEMRKWFEDDPGYDAKRLQATFAQMLGPKARPDTRSRVLASAQRLSPATFLAIRKTMLAYPATADAEKYRGPKLALMAAGNDLPAGADKLPGARRADLPDVSHWLMMDAPEAFAHALDAFLEGR